MSMRSDALYNDHHDPYSQCTTSTEAIEEDLCCSVRHHGPIVGKATERTTAIGWPMSLAKIASRSVPMLNTMEIMMPERERSEGVYVKMVTLSRTHPIQEH